MLIQTVYIKRSERGLVYRRGDFVGLLTPGAYRRYPILDILLQVRIQKISILETRFEHRLKDILLKDERLLDAVQVVDVSDGQRALGWKDGRIAWILDPGTYGFWKEPYDLRFEIFDVGADARLRIADLDAVLAFKDASRSLAAYDIAPNFEVLVFRDGKLIDRAREGRLVYWRDQRKLNVYAIDLREQTMDVSGQEILTRDKVTLRLNLAVTYRVTDPLKTVTVTSDSDKALYREAQLALRLAIGARTLDALLTDKTQVDDEIMQTLAQKVGAFGVAVESVGLRDIILPGDMKALLNRVVEAQKEAEANLIRRREETAAARSQANTAKLLAENPVLARMKELEALKETLAGVKATFVLGRGDLVSQLSTLTSSDKAKSVPPRPPL